MNPLAANTLVQERYLIVQMIGSGQMGEVYMAVDQWSGSAVALKRTVFASDKALAEALETEAKVLVNLHHPVLPRVVDHFVEDGAHFLVMEQISGDDLEKRLENSRKPFPLSWSMFWADQLLDALTYLHSHAPAIIHNDIKPKNLKLTDENHIVLLDFGLAKDQGAKASAEAGLGTSPFESPERVRAVKTSMTSDIYSFSAVFYQLMTNVPPIDALTRSSALESGSPDPLRPLSDVNPDISKDISDVILKGLEISREKRFAVAVEMQKALRRAFKNAQAGTSDRAAQELVSAGAGLPQTAGSPDAPTVELSTPQTQADTKQSDIKTEAFSSSDFQAQTAETIPVPPVVAAPAAPVATEIVRSDAVEPEPSQSFQTAVRQPPPPAAKSSSKMGLIIGGLIGLLVIAGVAAAGGWYVYSKYYASGTTSPTPVPSPSVAVSPTPAPVLTEGNTAGNSNASVAEVPNANTTDSNKTTATVQTPGGPVTGRPTPLVPTKNVPAKTTQSPGTKTTPKPKGGDDRTVILQ